MRVSDTKKLHPGDQVKWNDPDEGTCSRVLTIQTIEINGNVFTIMEPDGSVIMGYARELG